MSKLSDSVDVMKVEIQETKASVVKVIAKVAAQGQEIEALKVQFADNPALVAALDAMKVESDQMQADLEAAAGVEPEPPVEPVP